MYQLCNAIDMVKWISEIDHKNKMNFEKVSPNDPLHMSRGGVLQYLIDRGSTVLLPHPVLDFKNIYLFKYCV